jgi:hypothetical protein
MTYLFKPYDGEVKNDTGNPLPVSKNTSNNTAQNPIFVDTGLIIPTEISVSNLADIPAYPTTLSVTQGTTPWQISKNTNANSAQNPIFVDTGLTIPAAFDGEIKNDSGNPIPISKNTSTNSDTNPIFVKGTSDTSFFSPTQSDAFGRLRVSNPFTLYDLSHRYQDNGHVAVYTNGTASSTHNANSSTIDMTIGTANGDSVIRETNRVFAYQPGKSLQILTTFCMNPSKPNLVQRIGYFDTSNGLYLERNNTGVYFVLRSSSAGGAPVERRIEKANWNVNTFPTLNLDRVQILWWDIEWLGVGSVRCGFVVDGAFVHCHTFNNANTEISTGVPLTTTYMGTACLPLRSEITNTGTTSSSSTLKAICASVISEGGFELRGRPQSVGHLLNSAYRLSSINTVYPLISIRLKSGRDGAIILPKNFSFAPLTQANYRWNLIQGITTGGTWVSAGTDSSVEYNLTATSVTSTQFVYEQGYVLATNQSTASPSTQVFPFAFQLERNTLTSPKTYYEFILTASTTAQNPDVVASINWEELT